MTKARLWTVRAVLLFIALLYTFIGYLFVTDPVGTSDSFKTVADSPTAITTIRVTYGMGFLSLALTAWFGLARPKHAFEAVTFLLVMVSAVVMFRLYGLAVDGVSDRNLEELRHESTGLVLLAIAWFAFPRPMPGAAP
jgi:hypothetical protein